MRSETTFLRDSSVPSTRHPSPPPTPPQRCCQTSELNQKNTHTIDDPKHVPRASSTSRDPPPRERRTASPRTKNTDGSHGAPVHDKGGRGVVMGALNALKKFTNIQQQQQQQPINLPPLHRHITCSGTARALRRVHRGRPVHRPSRRSSRARASARTCSSPRAVRTKQENRTVRRERLGLK